MSDLGPIEQLRRSGSEVFHESSRELGFSLLGFWQWAYSDSVANTTRGVLAEYLVAQALGVASGVRDPWAAYDLESSDGVPVEVKSSSYIQSWHQDRYSSISFVYPKTRGWDAETNKLDEVKQRHAKVYVFALLAHKNQSTLDPLDVSQWEFYVLPTSVLDRRTRSQHSITLKSLRDLHGEPLTFADLRTAVEAAAAV